MEKFLNLRGVWATGKTFEECRENLREAVILHLEGEDLSEFGLAPNPTLLVTMELESIAHVA